jgi:hypothetical protein
MEKFIKENSKFLEMDTQAMFYHAIYQNLALSQLSKAEQTLSRG